MPPMIADLGKSIGGALKGLFNGPVTDEAVEDALKEICMLLIRNNVSPVSVAKLREDVRKKVEQEPRQGNTNRARMVQKAVFNALIAMLNPGAKAYVPVRGRTNVIVFVGLQGCGKTTSICKYANYHKRKGFRVGIVCADTFRAGAFDQVKQNALKIGVPFFGSGEPDPVKVAREGVAAFRKADFELVLVDTSGRHVQEDALFAEMRELVAAVKPDNILFVMDAGIGQSAEDQARGFKEAVSMGGIILTKLDGAEKAGGALSSVAMTGCPIEFVGTGEGMEDLEPFNPKGFVSRMLGMGDLESLAEMVGVIDIDEEELAGKLASGSFKLSDFKKIYGQIMGLGPLSRVLSMIPGMQGVQIPDESKFKRITYIFDSMNRKELNSNGDILLNQPSRLRRIALGSGTSEGMVKETIINFRKMNKMMRELMNNPMFSQMAGRMGGGDIGSLFNFMK